MDLERNVPQSRTIDTVCRNIRARIAYLDITQSELARRVGVSPRTMNYWVTGVRQPRTEELKQIADALEVPVGYLYEEAA